MVPLSRRAKLWLRPAAIADTLFKPNGTSVCPNRFSPHAATGTTETTAEFVTLAKALLNTTVYSPDCSYCMFVRGRRLLLAPAKSTPLNCHWYAIGKED
jgi:hypothetical protein